MDQIVIATRQARVVPWLAGIGVATCAVATVALADAALEGDGLASADPSIASTMIAHRSDALTALARAASLIGGEISIAVLSVVVLAVLLINRRRREAVVFAVAMAGAAVLVVGIKHAVMRARPGPRDLLGPVDSTYSFPSGHTLFTAVFLAMLIWLVWPRLSGLWRPVVVAAAALLALLVGVSRVYLGYHWPTDVLASWLIAAGWLGVVYLGIRAYDWYAEGPRAPIQVVDRLDTRT